MSHSGQTVNVDEHLPLIVPEFWIRRGKTDDGGKYRESFL